MADLTREVAESHELAPHQTGASRKLRTLGGPGSGNFGHAGRPGEVGGSTTIGPGRDTVAIVRRRADTVAEEMGISSKIINVVDKEPRAFKVGDQEFKEAGHYNPATGMIEINARNAYHDRMSVTNGLVAHEISHAMYDVVKKESDEEFKRFLDKAYNPSGLNFSSWHEERFYMDDTYNSRKIKPGFEDEVAKEFPASHALLPLSDGFIFTGVSEKVRNENGHSAYARSYWTKEALVQAGYTPESAINETIAEVNRYLTHPASWHESGQPTPKSPWVRAAQNIRKVYPSLAAKRGSHQS